MFIIVYIPINDLCLLIGTQLLVAMFIIVNRTINFNMFIIMYARIDFYAY